MRSEPIKVKDDKCSVVGDLKDYVIDHAVKPGDSFPTKEEWSRCICADCDDIRGMIKGLSFLGIVRSIPSRGLKFGEVDIDHITTYLAYCFSVGHYPRELLLRARIVIERGTLPYIQKAMAADQNLYQELLALATQLEAENDLDKYIERDIDFHRALVKAGGIQPLCFFVDLLQTFFVNFREHVSGSRLKKDAGVQVHGEIVRALYNCNLEIADSILCEHLNCYQKCFLQ